MFAGTAKSGQTFFLANNCLGNHFNVGSLFRCLRTHIDKCHIDHANREGWLQLPSGMCFMNKKQVFRKAVKKILNLFAPGYCACAHALLAHFIESACVALSEPELVSHGEVFLFTSILRSACRIDKHRFQGRCFRSSTAHVAHGELTGYECSNI